MSDCNACKGNCGSCKKELVLSQGEIDLLQALGQFSFLPVARKPSETEPVCLEFGEGLTPIILCLEKKGLIDIDYHQPLKSFDYSAYSAYSLQGSMALTLRGQEVLDTLELQGITEA
jgi:hypothetical protein